MYSRNALVVCESETGSRPSSLKKTRLTANAPLRKRLTKLRGKKRATVALARRIGVVLHRMWRDGTEFRYTREEAMALRTA